MNQPPRCRPCTASKLCRLCAVSEENWRTPFWVDLCQEAGMVLRKLRRDQVTCRPLPVPVPLAGMQGVRCVPCLGCYTSITALLNAVLRQPWPSFHTRLAALAINVDA